MQIGPYEIETELGRGGMGAVFLARDPRSGARVVVKTLRWSSAEAVARFEREARIGIALQHPGIVKTLETGEDPSGPYLVMEHVEGVTLAALIARKLEPLRAAEIVRDVALAVDHAHREGVIHRDLKPHNVLVDSRGKARVADFGLSRLAGDATLSATGEVLGTASYLPPEQVARGATAHGVAGDVWALGAILFETLAGHPPFRAATTVNLLSKIAREPPESLPRETPRAFVAIVQRCLEKEPGARFATARALARALDVALARSQGPSPRLHALLALAAVAVALAVAAAVFWPRVPGPALPRPTGPGPPAPKPPSPRPPAPKPPTPSSAPTIDDHLRAAHEALRSNRVGDAIAAYTSAIALDPRSVSAREGRALALVHLNQGIRATQDLAAIPPERLGLRGHSLDSLFKGRVDELDRLVGLATGDDAWIPWYARALWRLTREDFKGARDDADTAVSLAEWCAPARYIAGQARARGGDVEAALAIYDAVAVQWADPGGMFFFERGRVRHVLDDVRGAIEDFTRSLAIEEFAFSRFERAQGLEELEDFAAARDEFHEYATRHANGPLDLLVSANWHAADCALALGDTIDALSFCSAALRANPADEKALDRAVKTFQIRKSFEQDVSLARDMAAKRVDEPSYWSMASAAEEARGDGARAAECLEKLRALLVRGGAPTKVIEARIRRLRGH